MNEITLLMAQLADSSYANLTSSDQVTRQTALTTVLQSKSEAIMIADRFDMTQRHDPITGLSAAVFKNRESGEVTLAIRGTDDGIDVIVDGLLALGAPSQLNAQYVVLKEWIDEWSQPTITPSGEVSSSVLPPSFSVTGHSLGGHLAAAVKSGYPERAGDTYLFNAPGVGSVLGSVASLFQQAFNTSPPGEQGLYNIRGSEGLSLIAGLGYHLSSPIWVQTETPPSGSPLPTHSMSNLRHGVAVEAAMSKLSAFHN